MPTRRRKGDTNISVARAARSNIDPVPARPLPSVKEPIGDISNMERFWLEYSTREPPTRTKSLPPTLPEQLHREIQTVKPVWWKGRISLRLCSMLLFCLYFALNLTSYKTRRVPALEKYSSSCPPHFLFRHSPNLVLGLPNPIFSSWGAPKPLVHARLKQLSKCWHPDKQKMHAVDKQHMRDIYRLISQAAEEYPYNTTLKATNDLLSPLWEETYPWVWDEIEVRKGLTWEEAIAPTNRPQRRRKSQVPQFPRFVPAPPPPSFNTSLPHIRPDCECSIEQTLSEAMWAGLTPFFLHESPPQTEVDLATYCACPLSGVLSTLADLYRMMPPKQHQLWDDTELARRASTNPFLWLLRYWGRGSDSSNKRRLIQPCWFFSDAKAQAWIKDGWAEVDDFENCLMYGKMKWLEEIFEQRDKDKRLAGKIAYWQDCIETLGKKDRSRCGRYPGEEEDVIA